MILTPKWSNRALTDHAHADRTGESDCAWFASTTDVLKNFFSFVENSKFASFRWFCEKVSTCFFVFFCFFFFFLRTNTVNEKRPLLSFRKVEKQNFQIKKMCRTADWDSRTNTIHEKRPFGKFGKIFEFISISRARECVQAFCTWSLVAMVK